MWSATCNVLNVIGSRGQGHLVNVYLSTKYPHHIGTQGHWIQRQCHNLVWKVQNSNVYVHAQYRFWLKTAQNDLHYQIHVFNCILSNKLFSCLGHLNKRIYNSTQLNSTENVQNWKNSLTSWVELSWAELSERSEHPIQLNQLNWVESGARNRALQC